MRRGPGGARGGERGAAFHMAFHELATNAAKYGALSVPGGQVSVRWQIRADEHGQELGLTWQETGGPAVGPPGQRGFGSVLIEQALAAEFGGERTLAFAPGGSSAPCARRFRSG
jgi:two-component sensor histidine kinase